MDFQSESASGIEVYYPNIEEIELCDEATSDAFCNEEKRYFAEEVYVSPDYPKEGSYAILLDSSMGYCMECITDVGGYLCPANVADLAVLGII